jgi:heptaprenyl diphosphate synthase
MGMREIRLAVTHEDRRIAGLAALAVGLTLAEAALPSPIPGVKPGLANIVILLVKLRYGFRTAVWVMAIRLLAGSLVLGSFLSPGFWLAAAGAVASMCVLYLVRYLPRALFGPVSFSVLMAYAHICGQLFLAKLWLFSAVDISLLMPIFALAALVFGAANGLIVARLIAEDSMTGAQSAHV